MSTLKGVKLSNYINKLPIGPPPHSPRAVMAMAPINTIDINNLPNGIVTGSNLIQFPPTATAEIKSSVALSLLAAQRVATNDHVVISPSLWLARHNMVMQSLNWNVEQGGHLKSHFNSFNVAVHEAIIPFLTAAFAQAAAVGTLIITALQQLQKIDKDAPWITLFDQQSRRFDVTEYQFSIVQVEQDTVHLKMAAARLDASYGRTQVLFFKITTENAEFEQANQSFSSETTLLTEMNAELKNKLAAITKLFIRSLPDNLLQ